MKTKTIVDIIYENTLRAIIGDRIKDYEVLYIPLDVQPGNCYGTIKAKIGDTFRVLCSAKNNDMFEIGEGLVEEYNKAVEKDEGTRYVFYLAGTFKTINEAF